MIQVSGRKRKKRSRELKSNLDGASSEFQDYNKGVVIGALVGGIGAMILGRKIIFGVVIGGLAGGYIAYEVNNSDGVKGIKKLKL